MRMRMGMKIFPSLSGFSTKLMTSLTIWLMSLWNVQERKRITRFWVIPSSEDTQWTYDLHIATIIVACWNWKQAVVKLFSMTSAKSRYKPLILRTESDSGTYVNGEVTLKRTWRSSWPVVRFGSKPTKWDESSMYLRTILSSDYERPLRSPLRSNHLTNYSLYYIYLKMRWERWIFGNCKPFFKSPHYKIFFWIEI